MNQKQKANNPKLRPLSPRRIRQVRPDFFKNENVANLTMAARLGFIGIWILCDKHGHFEWRPRILKSDIYPHDMLDFEAILTELQERGFINKYIVDGKEFGQVNQWENFQHIGLKESQMELVYPEPSRTSRNVSQGETARTF